MYFRKVWVIHIRRGGGRVSTRKAFETARELRDEILAETDELIRQRWRRLEVLEEHLAYAAADIALAQQRIANLTAGQCSEDGQEFAITPETRAPLLLEASAQFLQKNQKRNELLRKAEKQMVILEELDQERLGIGQAFYRQIGANENIGDFPIVRQVAQPIVYLT